MFSRHLLDVLPRRVAKTSSRHLQDILKTSSRRLGKLCFKTYHQVKLLVKLSGHIQYVSKTYCKDIYLQKDLRRSHFCEIYIQFRKFARVIKISQVLVFLKDVLKMPWRRLEEVWPRRIYWSWSRHLEDVLKMSFENVRLRQTYSSWSKRLEDGTACRGVFRT